MSGGRILGFLLIIMGIIAFVPLLNAFDSMQRTENSTIQTVATAGGITTGNVTLNNALYGENLDNIIQITSTEETDEPAPASYNEITYALTVSGLVESDSRALTVTYYAERDDDYIGYIMPILPFFILICFTIGGGLMIWRG